VPKKKLSEKAFPKDDVPEVAGETQTKVKKAKTPKKEVKKLLDAREIVAQAWMRPCPNMCLILRCPFFERCWKFRLPESEEKKEEVGM